MPESAGYRESEGGRGLEPARGRKSAGPGRGRAGRGRSETESASAPLDQADRIAGRLDQTDAQWARVRVRLRDEVGETAFRTWLMPMTLLPTPAGAASGTVRLTVPTRFMRDWVMTHYGDRIRALWLAEDPSLRLVDFVVAREAAASLAMTPGAPAQAAGVAPMAPGRRAGRSPLVSAPAAGADGMTQAGVDENRTDPPAAMSPASAAALSPGGTESPRRLARRGVSADTPAPLSPTPLSPAPVSPTLSRGPAGSAGGAAAAAGFGGAAGLGSAGDPEGEGALSAPLDPRFTFDNFVVGKPNEFAYAAARRVAESPAVSFNPLFLYGGVGLGKTHLMHAIAREVRGGVLPRRVIYLSAEQFMNRFIRALRQHDTLSFKEQFRSVDVLMVDDIQFISGKDSTQEEFFHTFNALVDQGRQIVLSADKSPSDLENIGQRLRSRMACGLVADLHPTTFELRVGILQSKAENLGVEIPEKVIKYIAHKISSNGREVEGALVRLVAHAQLVGRSFTIETAQEVLHDLVRAYDKRVSVDEIKKRVAEHYKIRLADMDSARRARAIARPRQVAMYLCKQLTSRSLPDIGKNFGGRDHTTVMHAVRKVEELIELDSAFAEDVELLRRMLEA